MEWVCSRLCATHVPRPTGGDDGHHHTFEAPCQARPPPPPPGCSGMPPHAWLCCWRSLPLRRGGRLRAGPLNGPLTMDYALEVQGAKFPRHRKLRSCIRLFRAPRSPKHKPHIASLEVPRTTRNRHAWSGFSTEPSKLPSVTRALWVSAGCAPQTAVHRALYTHA